MCVCAVCGRPACVCVSQGATAAARERVWGAVGRCKKRSKVVSLFRRFTFFLVDLLTAPPPSKTMSTDAAAAMRMAEQEMEYRVELFNK